MLAQFSGMMMIWNESAALRPASFGLAQSLCFCSQILQLTWKSEMGWRIWLMLLCSHLAPSIPISQSNMFILQVTSEQCFTKCLSIMERRVTLKSNLSDLRITYPAVHQVSGKCHWKMYQYHASQMENIWRNLFSDKNRCLATMARRAALQSALSGVRFSYPAVPQLREFQVTVRGYC